MIDLSTKVPLSKKRKTVRWVMVALMIITIIAEIIIGISAYAAEGWGSIGAGLVFLVSIIISSICFIVYLIVWIALGIRKKEQ